MRATRADARIGTAFSMSPCEPAGDDERDAAAAERWHGFVNGWYLEPALYGRYPESFVAGTPHQRMCVRDGDLERVKAPLDFIGINLYMRTIVAYDERAGFGMEASAVGPMGGNNGPKTDFGWEVWPQALHDMVVRVTRDHGRPVIEITENGGSYADGPDADGVIHDTRRIDFYRGYLEALARAMEAGADVRGYHAWTLMDNFEWAEGFHQRFGLAWVDFDDPARPRTLKQSGEWYGRVAADNGFDT